MKQKKITPVYVDAVVYDGGKAIGTRKIKSMKVIKKTIQQYVSNKKPSDKPSNLPFHIKWTPVAILGIVRVLKDQVINQSWKK